MSGGGSDSWAASAEPDDRRSASSAIARIK
jgi:hypothetical protein